MCPNPDHSSSAVVATFPILTPYPHPCRDTINWISGAFNSMPISFLVSKDYKRCNGLIILVRFRIEQKWNCFYFSEWMRIAADNGHLGFSVLDANRTTVRGQQIGALERTHCRSGALAILEFDKSHGGTRAIRRIGIGRRHAASAVVVVVVRVGGHRSGVHSEATKPRRTGHARVAFRVRITYRYAWG